MFALPTNGQLMAFARRIKINTAQHDDLGVTAALASPAAGDRQRDPHVTPAPECRPAHDDQGSRRPR
jgi:hypothetical protein